MPSSSSYAPNDMDIIQQNGNRFGYTSLSFSDLISSFDVSKFPDYENGAEPYLAYIIMSRPDLNNSSHNRNVLSNHTMTSAFYNDQYGRRLFEMMSDVPITADGYSSTAVSNSQMFMPIITTRAMSYQTVDMGLKTVEKGNTFYGHVIKYGKHSEEHKVGGTFSIDFRNDRYLSIMKMMYLWMSYIWLVSKTGEIEPRMDYQQNGVLDYAASVYYFVTKRNARELVFWEKLTGVFPKTLPFSIFSYNDEFILQDRFSVEFDYGIRSDPCDPEILLDLNTLSGISYTKMSGMTLTDISARSVTNRGFTRENFVQEVGLNNIAFVNSLESPFALGNSLAECPYVHTVKADDGTIHYYLDWIKDVSRV